jgi:uncharacterized cupredoxin-like copper-binding protein
MHELLARIGAVSPSRRLSRRDMLRLSAGAGLTAALLPALAACGGNDDDAPTATAATGSGTPTGDAGTPVEVVLADFSVKATPASVAAGTVTFTARNDGAMEHELVIIKTDLAPDDLPMTGDGSKADEAAAGTVIGKIQEIEPEDAKSDSFSLEAGAYVLICNIPGHYQAGMRAAFEVT